MLCRKDVAIDDVETESEQQATHKSQIAALVETANGQLDAVLASGNGLDGHLAADPQLAEQDAVPLNVLRRKDFGIRRLHDLHMGHGRRRRRLPLRFFVSLNVPLVDCSNVGRVPAETLQKR